MVSLKAVFEHHFLINTTAHSIVGLVCVMCCRRTYMYFPLSFVFVGKILLVKDNNGLSICGLWVLLT